MIAQLAAQLMAYATAQVNIRNGDNINSGNNQFHGNRHTSGVNNLRGAGQAEWRSVWIESAVPKARP